MEKINLDLFDNIFYQIKGTKTQPGLACVISYGFFPHKQFIKMNAEHELSNRK